METVVTIIAFTIGAAAVGCLLWTIIEGIIKALKK